jgi:hypothetical protein
MEELHSWPGHLPVHSCTTIAIVSALSARVLALFCALPSTILHGFFVSSDGSAPHALCCPSRPSDATQGMFNAQFLDTALGNYVPPMTPPK